MIIYKIIGGRCYYCVAFNAVKKQIVNNLGEVACKFCHQFTSFNFHEHEDIS